MELRSCISFSISFIFQQYITALISYMVLITIMSKQKESTAFFIEYWMVLIFARLGGKTDREPCKTVIVPVDRIRFCADKYHARFAGKTYENF